jgi:hypothetical protein
MKKTLFISLVPLVLVFLTFQLSFSQVYRWVDEKGVSHFTDDITQVPREFKSKTERIEAPQEKEDPKSDLEIAPTKKEASYKDQLGRGEDYWKGRVEEWRKKLREQQDKLEGLRTRYNGLTEKYNDSRNLVERTNLRRERDKIKTEMDERNAQIDEARGMMDKKIPEEAELYKAKPEWVKQ